MRGTPFASRCRVLHSLTSTGIAGNVWGYHAFNLLVHIAAALTLFGIVRRTLLNDSLRDRYRPQSTDVALAVSLLWVVHPLTTASVTYVIQRVESLMGLFYLLTLYCAIRAWDQSPSRRPVDRRVRLACGLGMATKESMVSAPLAVFLWDLLFAPIRGERTEHVIDGGCMRGSRRPGSFWRSSSLAITVRMRPDSISRTGRGGDISITQAGVILHYLRLVFVPWPLVLDYDWHPVSLSAANVPASSS